jgi:Zn-dependent metalloprotease
MIVGFLLCGLMILAALEIPANVANAPAADKAALEDIARSYLQGNVATVGVDNRIPEIQLSKIKEARSFYVTSFVQTYNGLPVYNSTALVLISKDGLQPVDAVSQFKRVSAVINTKIDAQDALEIATGAIAEKVVPRGLPKTEEMLCTFEAPSVQLSTGGVVNKIPLHGATTSPQAARVCWQVNVPTLDPLGDWSILVDGPTGKVISKQNLIFFETGDGWVYRYSNPIQTGGNLPWPAPDDLNHDRLTEQETDVQLLHLASGTGKLVGDFVDLTAPGISGGYIDAGQADESSRSYQYTRENLGFEEVMVYYYVDSVHSYLQQIGEGGLLNYPVPAHAHYYDEANAFYDPWDLGLHFGDGPWGWDSDGNWVPEYPIDTAEDADVIIHEYGHAIHGDQGLFNGWVSEEMGAFSEGFSDYLSASFLDQGAPGTAGCLSEWFGYGIDYHDNPSAPYPYCLRDTFSTMHYPEDMNGEEHYDGMMWSAALWRLRGLLGKDAVDRLAVETGYYLWSSASFRDAVKAMVQVDRVVYGGAHESTIRQVFRDNGMLSYWIGTQAHPWGPWTGWQTDIPDEDRGFENGWGSWNTESSDPSVAPVIVDSPVFAGSHAAELKGSEDGSPTESSIYHEFDMPNDATWVNIRFRYLIDTNDYVEWDWLEVRVGTPSDYIYTWWLENTGGQFYWREIHFPTGDLRGQPCRLTFLLHDDGNSGDATYVYLDGGGRNDIALWWSDFHAPITLNGVTQDTPKPSWPTYNEMRVLDGTPVSVSAPSQVVMGSVAYQFMDWWPDGELDSTHPLFTPSQDTYLEANYNEAWAVPFTSYSLGSPVSLDGRITSPAEWSDAVPQDLTLPKGSSGPDTVPARFWMKNDANWLYILERVTWSGPTSARSDGDISYYWDWYDGKWPHSDLGGVNFDGTTFDGYGWDETTWYDDPVNNVQGAATHDGTYYWFEFRKALDSGDGYDWTFVPGGTYGTRPPDLMVGFWDDNEEAFYGAHILLQVAPVPPSLQLFPAEISGMTVTVNGVALPGMPGTSITKINWDWGDGTSGDAWFPATHTYSKAGTYTIIVTAFQSDGLSTSQRVELPALVTQLQVRSKTIFGLEFSGVRVKVEGQQSGRRWRTTLATPFSLELQGPYKFTAPNTVRVGAVKYYFAGWEESGRIISTSKSMTYLVQPGKTLYAVYGPKQYKLTVEVKMSGARVPGATVEVTQLGKTYTAVTNSRGKAIITGIYAGQPFSLKITVNGEVRYQVTLTITKNTTHRANIT